MRFASIRGKGLGVAFPGEFFVDFDALPGPLVAITGENGAGKTTLLELLGGSMYRVCATRGSLSDLATARDSFLETVVVNGAQHRIRHVLDSVSGKGESVVTDEAGAPLVTSGKMREFDAWAAKHLPPREVFYASMFAAQGAGGFIGMKPGDRKAVLLRVLGIERLEALAEKARENVRTAKAAVGVLDARIADERGRAADPQVLAAELAAIEAHRPDLEGAVTLAQAALDQAVAAEQIARLARQDVDAHMARRSELVARLQIATTKTQDVERRLANNQGVLDRAEEIRSAVVRAGELDAKLADLLTAKGAATTALTAAENELAVVQQDLADFATRTHAAETRESRARSRLADRAVIEAAAEALPKFRAQLEVLEGDVGLIEMELREGQDLVLNSATTRIGALRTGLEALAAWDDLDTGGAVVAAGALASDDETAAKVQATPGILVQKRELLADKKREITSARSLLQTAERNAARATEIANAETEASEAATEAATLRARGAATRESQPAKTEAVTLARAVLATVEAKRGAATTEREQLQPLVKLAEPLAQAEARLAELQPQAETLRTESAAIKVDLDALGDLPENVVVPDLSAARVRVNLARDVVSSHESLLAVKRSQIDVAVLAAQKVEALLVEHRAASDEVSDWTRLADDLGRDGLQALEIDAAGPELTALVNDLLHTCVGTRWTVSIQASRLSADGKKILEGCDVSVLDTEKGREGEASTLSGGEGVIVGEAISLALSMLACRRSGVQGPTLVRDETGAALDPRNATAYVAMLRRACELVGASRCFFVSHNPDVQALADARLQIAGGKVTVTS